MLETSEKDFKAAVLGTREDQTSETSLQHLRTAICKAVLWAKKSPKLRGKT